MRKTEFADMLVVEGIYSTRTKALEAMDAGKVHMQNVDFEDLAHSFPLLDAYNRSLSLAQIARNDLMELKGFRRLSAETFVIAAEDDWPQLFKNPPYFWQHPATVRCEKGDKGAYESLMAGTYVRELPGHWWRLKSINRDPGQGCCIVEAYRDATPKETSTFRVPLNTIIYY